MAINIKEVPVKAYNSISKVKQHYIPLCYTYNIL
jgi:hypothetical protein